MIHNNESYDSGMKKRRITKSLKSSLLDQKFSNFENDESDYQVHESEKQEVTKSVQPISHRHSNQTDIQTVQMLWQIEDSDQMRDTTVLAHDDSRKTPPGFFNKTANESFISKSCSPGPGPLSSKSMESQDQTSESARYCLKLEDAVGRHLQNNNIVNVQTKKQSIDFYHNNASRMSKNSFTGEDSPAKGNLGLHNRPPTAVDSSFGHQYLTFSDVSGMPQKMTFREPGQHEQSTQSAVGLEKKYLEKIQSVQSCYQDMSSVRVFDIEEEAEESCETQKQTPRQTPNLTFHNTGKLKNFQKAETQQQFEDPDDYDLVLAKKWEAMQRAQYSRLTKKFKNNLKKQESKIIPNQEDTYKLYRASNPYVKGKSPLTQIPMGEIYHRNTNWQHSVQQKTDEKRKVIQQERLVKEMEECRFRPKINPVPEQLQWEDRLVEDRCLDWQNEKERNLIRNELKLKKIETDLCPFKPKTNSKSQGKSRNDKENLYQLNSQIYADPHSLALQKSLSDLVEKPSIIMSRNMLTSLNSEQSPVIFIQEPLYQYCEQPIIEKPKKKKKRPFVFRIKNRASSTNYNRK